MIPRHWKLVEIASQNHLLKALSEIRAMEHLTALTEEYFEQFTKIWDL